MEELNDGLKIYSEEVRDVLSDPPKTILRWGNTILLGFVFILFLLSWFIKYPDIISMVKNSISSRWSIKRWICSHLRYTEGICAKERILWIKISKKTERRQ